MVSIVHFDSVNEVNEKRTKHGEPFLPLRVGFNVSSVPKYKCQKQGEGGNRYNCGGISPT